MELHDEEMNLDSVDVSTKSADQGMTDIQVYGINSTIVKLLSKVRKYTILTQVQMDLVNKPHKIQPTMREIYQYEETKMIMDIREEFDMFYVYTKDKYVVANAEALREGFEHAIGYITSSMQSVENIMDDGYIQILDTFTDKLQQLSTTIATKSIFDEHFKIS